MRNNFNVNFETASFTIKYAKTNLYVFNELYHKF